MAPVYTTTKTDAERVTGANRVTSLETGREWCLMGWADTDRVAWVEITVEPEANRP